MSAARRGLLLLLALAALLAFAHTVCTRSLWSPDEGRYAEIGREMLASGDWVTPRLNAVRYFEKPPLVYWAIAASLGTFGLNEAAARLPIAAMMVLMLGCTWWLGTMVATPRAGRLAALLLAASPMIYILGQVVVLDMPLTALLTAALCCAWRGFTGYPGKEDGWRRWPLLSAAFLGLATLTKGPIAVVIAGMVLLPLLVSPDFRPVVAAAPWLQMLAVYLVITVPWFVLIGRAHPEFLSFFFVHEHLDRYFKTGHARPGAPWYFAPVIIFGFFPWSGLAPAALAAGPRLARGARRFLHAWLWLPLAFFSLSQSKLPPYVLPVFPALAVLVAAGLDELLERAPGPGTRRALAAGAGLTALLLAAGIYKAWRLDVSYYSDLDSVRLPALVPLSASLVMASAAAIAFVRGRVRGGIELLLAMTLVGLTAITFITPFYEPHKDSKVLAGEILARRTPAEKVVVYGTLESSSALPFYLRDPVYVAGHFYGELDMAHNDPRDDEASRFLDAAGVQKWMVPGQPRSWFLTQDSVYDGYFAPSPLFKLEVVRRYGGHVLFTNR